MRSWSPSAPRAYAAHAEKFSSSAVIQHDGNDSVPDDRTTGSHGSSLVEEEDSLEDGLCDCALSAFWRWQNPRGDNLSSIAQVHLNLGEFETGIDVYRTFGDRAGPSDPGARAGSAQNIGWALVLLGDEDAGESGR